MMQASEILFSTIKWVGVAYLLWLAWQMWHTKPNKPDHAQHPAPAQPQQKVPSSTYTPWQAFKRCWLVAISNPKGILPQFVSMNMPQGPQYLALAVVTIIIDICCMCIYTAGGVQAAHLLTSTNLQRMNRCSAIIMVCMAGGLALYRKAN